MVSAGFATGVLLAGVLASPPVSAQEAPRSDNPHGPLADECATCHGAEGWSPARISPKFDHSRFKFPLERSHRQTACRACHLSLVFKDTTKECVGCHQDVHEGELGDDCSRCHTPRSFIDRSRMARVHQGTRLPLTGAHLSTDCEDCHRGGVRGSLSYSNTRTDCVACHLEDYLAATDPNHQASGFSQNCTECHTPIAFRNARFLAHDASFFPIYSGTHRGQWTTCSDCHLNPASKAGFSCLLGCHQHADQTTVTNQHAAVSGFRYDSQACYACHPQGRKS